MNRTISPHALVVEGGAMSGIFASGVLDAFIEHDYHPFDFAIGVSAGATNLLAYLASQHGRSHDILTELACRQEFMDPLRFAKGAIWWISTGYGTPAVASTRWTYTAIGKAAFPSTRW